MTEGKTQSSLEWRPIAAGGCVVVAFAALLYLIWYSATTLFLLFSGVLFGVFLNALSDLLKRLIGGGHALRLTIVCLAILALLAGFIVLGGATIADQAEVLTATLKSQIGTVRNFLDHHGVDTSFFDLSPFAAQEAGASSASHNLPGVSAIASSTSTVLTQSLKILAGLFGTVGNIFVVILLGALLAAQPSVYRDGLIRLVRKSGRAKAAVLVDDIAEALRRFLLSQIVAMALMAVVVSISLSVIGIPGALALGVQTGLLTFIPTVGAVIAGGIILLACLGSGWAALLTAFALYLVVQIIGGNVVIPLIQKQAIDIPPATIFGAQILLGVLFGLWGLALAVPLIAVIKVVLRHVYQDADAELSVT